MLFFSKKSKSVLGPHSFPFKGTEFFPGVKLAGAFMIKWSHSSSHVVCCHGWGIDYYYYYYYYCYYSSMSNTGKRTIHKGT